MTAANMLSVLKFIPRSFSPENRGGIPLTRKQAFLIVQSVLCALTAGLLAVSALTLYLDGAAKQAAGDLFYPMFTREKVIAKLLPLLPLFFAALGMTAAGLILGIRDAKQDQPLPESCLPRDLSGLRDRMVRQDASPRIRIMRAVFIALAAVLILLGILDGGLEDVLAKGAAVCTECVGLG